SVTLGMSAGSLDMGGVAKGYAVDRAIAVLKARGVKNALVNLGGEIGVLGAGSNGRSWRIGVQHPRNTSMHIGVIELTDGNFVATSGDYERYFFENGRRYHHILDPDTGYPAARGAVSVTVITTSCLEADALATAAFVMGAESGSDFLESSGAMGLILCSTAAGPEKDPAVADISYKATESFLRLMTPDLEGLPLP
ncbi:MAG: FAD:protein FMN transferase, partial [Gemmatimonadota bacterium]|nr:FAD:protein FMN transferase [Gemmatimonadota bacterium]